MRIGINLLALYPGKIGGLEQYVRNLIWYTSHKNEGFQLFLFLNKENVNTFEELKPRVNKILVDNSKDRILQIYHWMIKCRLDLWFCPLLVLEPRYVKIPSLVTIPDIQHEFYPEFFDDSVLRWRHDNFKYTVDYADAILTISDYSKKTIISHYQIKENKVFSIYLDASKEFFIPPKEELNTKIVKKYRLPPVYGFYPANTWPHKNHLNFLKAVLVLNGKHGKVIPFILTGSADQAHSSIVQFIRDNGLTDQIRFLGYIPQREMPYIYRNSSFLIFPSLFEGFGIPLVEAMRAKTPIVCSNAGSIPEVVGDSGLLFNPNDPEDIALKILQVLDEHSRSYLVKKGSDRANKFSWEKSSEETLEIFKAILHGRDLRQ